MLYLRPLQRHLLRRALAPDDFIRYTAPYDFMQSHGLSAIGPPWSQLTAYDLNTGATPIPAAIFLEGVLS